jgi:hypothetical protein
VVRDASMLSFAAPSPDAAKFFGLASPKEAPAPISNEYDWGNLLKAFGTTTEEGATPELGPSPPSNNASPPDKEEAPPTPTVGQMELDLPSAFACRPNAVEGSASRKRKGQDLDDLFSDFFDWDRAPDPAPSWLLTPA